MSMNHMNKDNAHLYVEHCQLRLGTCSKYPIFYYTTEKLAAENILFIKTPDVHQPKSGKVKN